MQGIIDIEINHNDIGNDFIILFIKGPYETNNTDSDETESTQSDETTPYLMLDSDHQESSSCNVMMISQLAPLTQ